MLGIYINKWNDLKPYTEEQIVLAVQNGHLLPNDLACLHGMTLWEPVYSLIELPDEIMEKFFDFAEKEIKLLIMYRTNAENSLGDWTENENNPQLQSNFQNAVSLFQKQVTLCKQHFPEAEECIKSEATLYCFHAMLKVGNINYFRKASRRSETLVGTIFTGLIAKGQEKRNIEEAIKLLDISIQICNSSFFRQTKAEWLLSLRQKESAIAELNYIIENFSHDEESYFNARQLKDKLTTPVNRNSGCFGVAIFTIISLFILINSLEAYNG
jgi:hypothetical protein